MPLVSHQYIDAVNVAGRTRTRPRGEQTLPRWLVARIRQLNAKDRTLVELHFAGATTRSAGRAVGMSPGCVSRRVTTLLKRLKHPIVDRLQDEFCPLPIEHRVVGVEHFMLGRPLRWIAEHHQLDYRQVRAIIDCVRAWHEASIWSTCMRRAGEPSTALSDDGPQSDGFPQRGNATVAHQGSNKPFVAGDSLVVGATGRRASA